MKIRFGYTIGPETGAESLGPLAEDLELLGFDLLWVPEVLLSATVDPVVALSHVAARTTRLKLGAHVILPGRQPVQLAKALAQLDRLSGGRLLLLGVLGVAIEADVGAQGVERSARGQILEEMVPLMRRLWAGEIVDHRGDHFRLSDVSLSVTPVQRPLEMWLGGQAESALQRCGRMGDGWMPGGLLPREAAEKRLVIEAAAKQAGRAIDPEHFGANLYYSFDPLPDAVTARFGARRRDGRGAELVSIGVDALHRRIDEWVDAGFSKFLLRPAGPPPAHDRDLDTLAREVLPRTT